MVIADTSVWVPFLRDPHSDAGRVIDSLLAAGQVMMVGVVLAEILRGSRSATELATLTDLLTALEFLETDRGTWVLVGELSFQLRTRGLTVPVTDLSVAALAIQNGYPVYAMDEHFGWIPELRLYVPGAGMP